MNVRAGSVGRRSSWRSARVAASLVMVLAIVIGLPCPLAASIGVVGPTCADLVSVEEVSSQLEVELGSVAEAWTDDAPVVLLGCREEQLHIEIADPITGKHVSRVVPLPPPVGRARVIALAISQLFITSWLELLVDESVAEPSPGRDAAERRARDALAASDESASDAPTSASEEDASASEDDASASDHDASAPGRGEDATEPSVRASESAPPETLAERPPSSSHDLELRLALGARARTEGLGLGSIVGELGVLLPIDALLGVGLVASLDVARTTRAQGEIDVWVAELDALLALRPHLVGPLSLELGLLTGPAFLSMEGRPGRAGVIGGATRGLAWGVALRTTAWLASGPLAVGLALEGGGLVFATDGVVRDEPPVVVGGPRGALLLTVRLTPGAF